MSARQPLNSEQYLKKLANICLRSGISFFPTDELNQHILYKSAALMLEQNRVYSDKEINRALEYWLETVFPVESVDFISIRRWMVDAGYLTRNREGTAYEVVASAGHDRHFDNSVANIDVEQALLYAREEIARRKHEYLERNKPGS